MESVSYTHLDVYKRQEVIKEISKDKLVIRVTHNRELAEKHSTRIVELKDGKLLTDSNPVEKEEKIIIMHLSLIHI